MFIAVLIALLVLLSGVIAYVGDWLGSFAGKKRLSLFGTRPKRTGKIIGIGAGIAIMLVTLGISSLAFRNAWDTIFRAQRTLEQVSLLKEQERSLSSRVNGLQARVDDLNTLNEKLLEDNSTLLAQKDDLSSANETLKNDVETRTAQARNLEEDVTRLRSELDEQARKLESVTNQLEARGNLTYRDAELIATTVIDAQDGNLIRSELVFFIQDTNNATAQRGAGEVELDSDQFSSLVEAAITTPAPDVIILRSDDNQFGTGPLSVNVESFEDQKVFLARATLG